MKKTLFILALVVGFTMTAQETTQNEEATSNEKVEQLSELLTKLSEKVVVMTSDDFQDDGTSKLATLIAAMKKLEGDLEHSEKFQKLILATEATSDKLTTSYSVAVTSDYDNTLKAENFEKLNLEMTKLVKELKDSEVLKDLITKLANSDLAKDLAKKKKD